MSDATRISSKSMKLLAAVCWLAAPGLISCSGDSDHTGVVEVGSSFVLIGSAAVGDNTAGEGFGGRVAMVGDCLGIDTVTVVWPNGTRVVSEDPIRIDVPGVGAVGLGDEVTGGAEEYVGSLPKGVDHLPSSCPGDHVIAFSVG